MENQGITQSELAKDINKTRQAVNYYTLGETVPDADTLILISKRLGVSVDYLLGLSDSALVDTNTQNTHQHMTTEIIKTIRNKRLEYFAKYGHEPNFVKLPIWALHELASRSINGEFVASGFVIDKDHYADIMGLRACPTDSIVRLDEIEVF